MNLSALRNLTYGATSPVVALSGASPRIEGATPGCYALPFLSDEDYHQRMGGVSSSGLKALLRSPAHYQAYKRQPNKDTDARRFGRAAHARLLEPLNFSKKFAVWDGGRRQGSDFERFKRKHKGKSFLTLAEMDAVDGCVQSLLDNPDFPLEAFLTGVRNEDGVSLMKPAVTEFSIFWTDERTGVLCKVRLDAARLEGEQERLAFDLKTTDDAREESFSRQIAQLHYDLQAAFYVEGIRRFTGRTCPFMFGAVETEDPHGSMFHALGPTSPFMQNGQEKVQYALDLMAKCNRSGDFPAYASRGVREPTMLPWMQFSPPRSVVAHS